MSHALQSSETGGANGHPSEGQSYFLTQRALLVNEIAAALDSTLTHLNRLNRSLESVIGIGNEFSNVEALWSQFEGVMGQQQQGQREGQGQTRGDGVQEQTGGGAVDEERESGLGTPPVVRTR